jgi:hypothetical protein
MARDRWLDGPDRAGVVPVAAPLANLCNDSARPGCTPAASEITKAEATPPAGRPTRRPTKSASPTRHPPAAEAPEPSTQPQADRPRPQPPARPPFSTNREPTHLADAPAPPAGCASAWPTTPSRPLAHLGPFPRPHPPRGTRRPPPPRQQNASRLQQRRTTREPAATYLPSAGLPSAGRQPPPASVRQTVPPHPLAHRGPFPRSHPPQGTRRPPPPRQQNASRPQQRHTTREPAATYRRSAGRQPPPQRRATASSRQRPAVRATPSARPSWSVSWPHPPQGARRPPPRRQQNASRPQQHHTTRESVATSLRSAGLRSAGRQPPPAGVRRTVPPRRAPRLGSLHDPSSTAANPRPRWPLLNPPRSDPSHPDTAVRP